MTKKQDPLRAMREDRPLDALFPELTRAPVAQPLTLPAGFNLPAVHPRLLHVELEQGREWGIAVWSDAPETLGLLRATLEAALLRELSAPPCADSPPPALAGLHLACFVDLDPSALAQLGFAAATWDAEGWRDRMRAWRQEAAQAGFELPEAPRSVWRLPVAEHPLGEPLWQIEARLNRELAGELWGEHPGKPSYRLAAALQPYATGPLRPTLAGLDALGATLVSRELGALRWLPPQIFQGVCDMVAVTWAQALGAPIQWALCEPTPDGSALPPQLRLKLPGEAGRELPIALILLRLCVLPITHPDATPPLGAWLRSMTSPQA
jgi:hypothetical protein